MPANAIEFARLRCVTKAISRHRASVRFAYFFHESRINPRNGTPATDRLTNNKLRQFPRTGPLLKDLHECFQRPKGNSDTRNWVQSFLGGQRKPSMQGATVLESSTRPCLFTWSDPMCNPPRANRAARRHSAENARPCRGLQNRGTPGNGYATEGRLALVCELCTSEPFGVQPDVLRARRGGGVSKLERLRNSSCSAPP